MNINKQIYSIKKFDKSHKKKRKDKEQIWHFKKRFRERTGIFCTIEKIKEIVSEIQLGKLKKIGYQSRRVVMYEYIVDGNDYVLIYDRKRGNPCTLLNDCDELYEYQDEIKW